MNGQKCPSIETAARPSRAGRGLKQSRLLQRIGQFARRPALTGWARIETGKNPFAGDAIVAARPSRAGRGLKRP